MTMRLSGMFGSREQRRLPPSFGGSMAAPAAAPKRTQLPPPSPAKSDDSSTRQRTGGLFVSGRDASRRPKGTEIRYGAAIEHDERLQKVLQRETFFLTVVIPRHRTLGAAITDWVGRSKRPEVYLPVLLILVLHAGMASYCSTRGEEDEGVCAGGPVNADHEPLAYLSFGGDYGPPILNSLAVLMLSFYANTCLGLYKDAYVTCQELKHSIIELLTIVVRARSPLIASRGF